MPPQMIAYLMNFLTPGIFWNAGRRNSSASPRADPHLTRIHIAFLFAVSIMPVSTRADVRSDFAHADIVGGRTVFNIHGNNYRLITRIKQGGLEEMSTTTEIGDSVYAELLARSLPRPIRTETERARFAETLLALDDLDDLSPEEEALAEMLTLLIEDYEEKNYPLPQVSPNQSLNTLMEERGLKHRDIWPVLGNKGGATEVLSGRRSISKTQAKRLDEFFHVPIDIFV
jgi:HTH-type transcriptional regulator/antitoxin HigA